MQILHVSTCDISGGAERAAYRLHRGLLQTGITSGMLVFDKRSDDPKVVTPVHSRRIDHRLRRFSRRKLIAFEQWRIARSRQPLSEYFSSARSAYTQIWRDAATSASVLNLHMVARFIDYPSFFAALPRSKALVWTLHDVNAFTGGCHYAGPCDKFLTRCGACPQLSSTRQHDISRRTYNRKARAFDYLDIDRVSFVAPSAWMAREARRSALLGRFRIEHIPYGLDLDVFRPRDRRAARTSLGIQAQERVVLFVSHFLDSHRKGLDLFLSAVSALKDKSNVVLMSVGNGYAPKVDGTRTIHLGPVYSDLILSLAYNAADVFVIPSREDNLPLTATEAAACGCPVVGFAIGGMPDIVEDGRTGFLAKPFDTAQLRDAIEAAIVRRDELSATCRTRAERLFGMETQAHAYTKLYLELLERPFGLTSVPIAASAMRTNYASRP